MQQCSKVRGNSYKNLNKNVSEYVPESDCIYYMLLFIKKCLIMLVVSNLRVDF